MKESATIRDNTRLVVDVLSEHDDFAARYPEAVAACLRAAGAAFDNAGAAFASEGPVAVCALLTDDAEMRGLNARFRGLDRPTNVLSFPAETDDEAGDEAGAGAAAEADGRRWLGDIAISCETLEREAVRDGKAVLDHLRHLIVHGMLHLLGYDHETDDEAEIMERAEVEILAALGVGDPYREADAVRR